MAYLLASGEPSAREPVSQAVAPPLPSYARLPKIAQSPWVPPYTRLARFYHRFSRSFCPRYDTFLPHVARHYAFPIHEVLEIACGAGTLTVRLAERFKSVMGFDISEAMLELAGRACTAHANVTLRRADFHSFRLQSRFDVAICATDSLNYVANPGDLSTIFNNVALHLRPRGFFLFDVLNENALRELTTCDVEYRDKETHFVMYSEFDERLRRDVTRVVFADAVENHVRVPIELHDVEKAAEQSGFLIIDGFSDIRGERNFYILRAVS